MSRRKLPIIGNYKLVKQIGEGGFARTYLAEHRYLEEPACLKQNINMSRADEELLLKEAKVLWKLSFHSLPVLRDVIRHDDSFVFVMSYIDGKDLFKVVEEDYPKGMPPEHICYIIQRLLNALQYLHYYRIIHGDVKPQNVIFKPKEHNAVLVDFGLSTILPRRYTSCPGCTPAFAAPEQLEGKPPIPETDIYCLGVTLIHILGGNIAAKTLPDHVPELIRKFIVKMVRHDPLKRPSDVRPLIKEISEIREKVFHRASCPDTLRVK